MMNILQVVLVLRCGGLEKLTIQLSKGLIDRGHHVKICSLESAGELCAHAKRLGIEVISFNKKDSFDWSIPIALWTILRRYKIDVIHTHNPCPLIYGSLAAKFAGTKAIINTRHGRAPEHVSRYIWNLNDFIIAISNDAQDELSKNNTIDPNKMRVIHNGIDTSKFKYSHLPCDKNISMRSNASGVIGTVSRLSPEKDQYSLISAFKHVVSLCPLSRLAFVGDGPLMTELKCTAEKHRVGDKATFYGFREDVDVILQSIDIFVLPSLEEGVSLSLLEAMAAGKPVVATNVGGNPEVVVDGVTGILVPPKDPEKLAEAILKLIRDPGLAKRMGEAGRKRVEEKFSLDRMVSEYEALYEDCLSKTRDRRPKTIDHRQKTRDHRPQTRDLKI